MLPQKCLKGWSLARRLEFYSAAPNTNGCVLWTGGLSQKGYGILRWRETTAYSHRLAWELLHGAIPGGMQVCHKCDVPACVNAEHLFLGTQNDNMADMVSKGRARRPHGSMNPAAKLTDEQVIAIRADTRSQVKIAAAYGIGQTSVSAVKRRETWANL